MTEGSRVVWALPTNSFRVVRRVLGVVLLIAAALKGYAVATEPIIGTGILGTRWFAIAVVNVEMFCGMWLLLSWLPVWTWRGAVALFSLFAVISVSKIIAGEASCGCFGRVPVSPWWTLGFDLVAMGALVWAWPMGCTDLASKDGTGARGYAMGMPAIAFLAIAVAANVLLSSYRPSFLAEDGVIVGDSGVVVLEPEKWVGKPFPLLKYIDIGDQLATGQWRVLLYHHDCPTCQEVVRSYLTTGSDTHSRQRAIVEFPPFELMSVHMMAHGLLRGKISSERNWFFESPLELFLADGYVSGLSGEREAHGDHGLDQPQIELGACGLTNVCQSLAFRMTYGALSVNGYLMRFTL